MSGSLVGDIDQRPHLSPPVHNMLLLVGSIAIYRVVPFRRPLLVLLYYSQLLLLAQHSNADQHVLLPVGIGFGVSIGVHGIICEVGPSAIPLPRNTSVVSRVEAKLRDVFGSLLGGAVIEEPLIQVSFGLCGHPALGAVVCDLEAVIPDLLDLLHFIFDLHTLQKLGVDFVKFALADGGEGAPKCLVHDRLEERGVNDPAPFLELLDPVGIEVCGDVPHPRGATVHYQLLQFDLNLIIGFCGHSSQLKGDLEPNLVVVSRFQVHEIHVEVASVVADVAERLDEIHGEAPTRCFSIEDNQVPPLIVQHFHCYAKLVHVPLELLEDEGLVGGHIGVDVVRQNGVVSQLIELGVGVRLNDVVQGRLRKLLFAIYHPVPHKPPLYGAVILVGQDPGHSHHSVGSRGSGRKLAIDPGLHDRQTDVRIHDFIDPFHHLLVLYSSHAHLYQRLLGGMKRGLLHVVGDDDLGIDEPAEEALDLLVKDGEHEVAGTKYVSLAVVLPLYLYIVDVLELVVKGFEETKKLKFVEVGLNILLIDGPLSPHLLPVVDGQQQLVLQVNGPHLTQRPVDIFIPLQD